MQYRSIFASKQLSMLPKITIITPSLNQGRYIEQSILSVIEQNYENLEYIIVDGGSTDETLQIIKKYEHKITKWISEPDLGQTDAINKGLKFATGEVFTWLNADDYYQPSALHIMGKAFEIHPNCNVVSAKANVIAPNGDITRKTFGVVIHNDIAKTIGCPVINQPETFFRTRILAQTGHLNICLRYNMDKDLWIKYLILFGQSNILKINHIVVNFRLHESSKTTAEGHKFTDERDCTMLGMAYWAGLSQEAIFIEELINMKPIKFDLVLADKKMVKKAIHYFLLLKADEYYVSGEKKKSRLCLLFLDKMLVIRDWVLYCKLFVRVVIIKATQSQSSYIHHQL